MNTYAIGDLQGCHAQAQALLALIEQTERAAGHDGDSHHLLFAGDLVNRGPQSLAALRHLRDLGERAHTVLGNHDLHLLARANGIGRDHRADTIEPILQADDRDDLIDWLRRRPLALLKEEHLLVHAGVLPQWSTTQTLELAHEVEQVLRGPQWRDFLRDMYGNAPTRWRDDLRGSERLRCIVNGLTRLRFCSADGDIDFVTKDGADSAPPGCMPWFDVPDRKSADTTIIFGHWSTLGLVLRDNLISLDTGCVWGGKLTAVRLAQQAKERLVLQVDCPQQQKPGDSV